MKIAALRKLLRNSNVQVAAVVGTTGLIFVVANLWLASTLSATTAPSTATIQATTGALAAGVYCARVKVTSPVARNSEPFTTTSPDFLVRFTVS